MSFDELSVRFLSILLFVFGGIVFLVPLLSFLILFDEWQSRRRRRKRFGGGL